MEHILICEIAAGLCEWHDRPSRLFELKYGELAAERVACYFAAGATRTLRQGRELPCQSAVEADGER